MGDDIDNQSMIEERMREHPHRLPERVKSERELLIEIGERLQAVEKKAEENMEKLLRLLKDQSPVEAPVEKRVYHCSRCGKAGHTARNCRKGQHRCKICGKYGHNAKTCPDKE